MKFIMRNIEKKKKLHDSIEQKLQRPEVEKLTNNRCSFEKNEIDVVKRKLLCTPKRKDFTSEHAAYVFL